MQVTAALGYELWADSYAATPNPILALEFRTLTALLDGLEPKRMLDVACGTGRWSLHYRQLGTEVVALDASTQMLAQAAKQRLLRGSLIRANAETLPIRSGWADLVLCSMSLGYFHSLSDVFREFARAAAADSTIAVSDLHPTAIAAGWTRSFKKDGKRFEIEHQFHSLAAIEGAGLQAGLEMTGCHTVYFDDSELPLFRAAGKEAAFAEVRETPALLVSLWKPRC